MPNLAKATQQGLSTSISASIYGQHDLADLLLQRKNSPATRTAVPIITKRVTGTPYTA
jgi:hypothetical protein